jgi:hypothetical protein
MKLTVTGLRRLIKEEYRRALHESSLPQGFESYFDDMMEGDYVIFQWTPTGVDWDDYLDQLRETLDRYEHIYDTIRKRVNDGMTKLSWLSSLRKDPKRDADELDDSEYKIQGQISFANEQLDRHALIIEDIEADIEEIENKKVDPEQLKDLKIDDLRFPIVYTPSSNDDKGLPYLTVLCGGIDSEGETLYTVQSGDPVGSSSKKPFDIVSTSSRLTRYNPEKQKANADSTNLTFERVKSYFLQKSNEFTEEFGPGEFVSDQ